MCVCVCVCKHRFSWCIERHYSHSYGLKYQCCFSRNAWALDNPRRLICHKTKKLNETKPRQKNLTKYIHIYVCVCVRVYVCVCDKILKITNTGMKVYS